MDQGNRTTAEAPWVLHGALFARRRADGTIETCRANSSWTLSPLKPEPSTFRQDGKRYLSVFGLEIPIQDDDPSALALTDALHMAYTLGRRAAEIARSHP